MAELFFTGKPCKNGHIDNRYESTGLCVTCTRERINRAAWSKKNPERRKQVNKKYREANREKSLAACKLSLQKKPEVAKAWVEANRQKVRSYKAKWASKNPEYLRLKKHQRRARESGRVSRDIGKKLLIAQRARCANCRCSFGESFHIDHIMPLARGGAHSDDNLQLLCAPCNQRKSAKDPIKWAQEQGRLL